MSQTLPVAATSRAPALKVLAVASGGGHWIQMKRMLRAFDDCDVTLVTTPGAHAEESTQHRTLVVRDATRWNKLGMLGLSLEVARIVAGTRPDVVFSTGAAPGCLALIVGRLLGARTVWLDSIANAERMSLSGRLVRPFASLWLTQWRHLAREGGPEYAGRTF
jgi:UDP-N-acetylglucosamine:LPS N-acetylglucosamine transferase